MEAFLDDVNVAQQRVRYGPRKGELRWFVIKGNVPMGDMHDFFAPGAVKVPYPFARKPDGEGETHAHSPGGQRDGFATEEEARAAYLQLIEHVKCVIALTKNKKPRGPRAWK